MTKNENLRCSGDPLFRVLAIDSSSSCAYYVFNRHQAAFRLCHNRLIFSSALIDFDGREPEILSPSFLAVLFIDFLRPDLVTLPMTVGRLTTSSREQFSISRIQFCECTFRKMLFPALGTFVWFRSHQPRYGFGSLLSGWPEILLKFRLSPGL